MDYSLKIRDDCNVRLRQKTQNSLQINQQRQFTSGNVNEQIACHRRLLVISLALLLFFSSFNACVQCERILMQDKQIPCSRIANILRFYAASVY